MAATKFIIRTAAVVFIAGAAALLSGCGKRETVAKKRAEPIVLIEPVVPPPPPPPPKETPPPPPDEKEPEMVQQEEIKEVTEPDPAPVDEPPALGTNMAPGNGPDNGYGLGKGGGTGGGSGKGGKGGGRFDHYAVVLQNTLAAELRRNPKTRASSFNVEVALRIDAEGRITSLKPKSSTGDPSLDQTLRNDFTGVRFSEPPPPDMPMPIHTRLSGRKR